MKKHDLRGPARMRQLGWKSVTVWLSPDELEKLDQLRSWQKRGSFLRALLERQESAKTASNGVGRNGRRVVKSHRGGKGQRRK